MTIPNETIIYHSKLKIMLLIAGALLFVAIGIWLVSLDTQDMGNTRKFNDPVVMNVMGYIGIVFFGFCGLFGIKKLFDNSPGLILNSEGLIDHSSGVAAGIVPWSEVVGINEYQIQKQKFVSILVKDPEKYVNSGNALKRMANKANLKMCGTPINISANSLKISYTELMETIISYYESYQK